jgi:thiol-disulfide isomerase/thioredoxin
MKKIGLILSLFVCFSAISPAIAKTEAKKTENITDNKAGKAKILAVKFYADWCGTCKKLAPGLQKVESKFKDKAVQFITMNLTDEKTTHQSEIVANSLGIGKIFKDNQGTGFVLLIEPVKHTVLGQLDTAQSSEQMIKTVDLALKKI